MNNYMGKLGKDLKDSARKVRDTGLALVASGVIAASVVEGVSKDVYAGGCENASHVVHRCLSDSEDPVERDNYQSRDSSSSWGYSLDVDSDLGSSDRTHYRLGVNWKNSDGSFEIGPYIRFGTEAEPQLNTSSTTTQTDIELVGPGVYRERTDYEQTDKETNVGNSEWGIRTSWRPFGGWASGLGFILGLGTTKETTKETRTLSSTVRFLDAPNGNVIDTEATDPITLDPVEDERNVATSEIGIDYRNSWGWNIGASFYKVFGEAAREGGRIFTGWRGSF